MRSVFLSELDHYKKWRNSLNSLLSNHQLAGASLIVTSANDSLEAMAWFNNIMAIPVSKRSVLGDSVWDFNDDYPNAARNIQGANLRIDFESFPAVNQLAMLEVKIATFCWLKFPSALKTLRSSKRSLKANTVISYVKCGLRFLNAMSVYARGVLTDEFFENGYHGVDYFDAAMYRNAAIAYPYVFNPDLERFFKVLRSPFIAEQVLDKPLPLVDLKSLKWASKVGDAQDPERSFRILPNDIFEKSSREASFAIVDFLQALDEPIADLNSLARKDVTGYEVARSHALCPRKLELYLALRLRRKGYSFKDMNLALGERASLYHSPVYANKFMSPIHLLDQIDSPLDDEFRWYINHISDSACYIVAQYTGMRPSELAEIKVESCLEEENDYWLLISNVIKHRQGLGKLFDDKWIAIPIVRDAIRAACLLAKITRNPYLFSSVDTVAPGKAPAPLNSSGIAYQFTRFFKGILTAEEFKELEFSPYTLRHTLAYQMARAELGLPFISFQLKHFGDLVGGAGQNKAFSGVTLGYGAIAEILSKGGRSKGKSPQQLAEIEYVTSYCDPEGNYAGPNGAAHKQRMQKVFSGYMAAGFSKDEVIDLMVKKRLAVINVGQAFCYGGRRESHDVSLPCIGSLRCNPNRCHNSVVTKAHAPKWREVYTENKLALRSAMSAQHEEELRAAMEEARGVLKLLGEEEEV